VVTAPSIRSVRTPEAGSAPAPPAASARTSWPSASSPRRGRRDPPLRPSRLPVPRPVVRVLPEPPDEHPPTTHAGGCGMTALADLVADLDDSDVVFLTRLVARLGRPSGGWRAVAGEGGGLLPPARGGAGRGVVPAGADAGAARGARRRGWRGRSGRRGRRGLVGLVGRRVVMVSSVGFCHAGPVGPVGAERRPPDRTEGLAANGVGRDRQVVPERATSRRRRGLIPLVQRAVSAPSDRSSL
jgi:hypothetical protein